MWLANLYTKATMADDAKLFRERAEAERLEASTSVLPNVRDRALRSAERWDEMARRAEQTQALSVGRKG